MIHAAIVIPTIREKLFAEFMRAWENDFCNPGEHGFRLNQHDIIVVEDNPSKTFRIEQGNVKHYAHEDIDAELGDDAWIIPRKTPCVRSYGIYKAWQMNPDIIITLDDDCFPCGTEPFIEAHYSKLTQPQQMPAWVPTIEGVRSRGYPYYNTNRSVKCAVSHGLWSKVPDVDAATQLHCGDIEATPIEQVIPRDMYFTMCSMNLAFRPEVAPLMYFLLMGLGYYDRLGDIWCGVFAKKILDHLGQYVHSGDPRVEHWRASNVWTNLRKEASGLKVNEVVWERVDGIDLKGSTITDCYVEIAQAIREWRYDDRYWSSLSAAMKIWAGLFL